MNISTPGEPDRVRTVENDIGEAVVKPQMAEKSVDQLKQAKGVSLKEDGVGKGKGIEPPTATKNGHDVQCERENEADAAEGQHLIYGNHVKKCESMMEKLSAIDDTATRTGVSSKFCSNSTSCKGFSRSLSRFGSMT